MKVYIYNIVSAILLLAASVTNAHADGGSYGDKTMCFVYVAQSELTSTGALEKYLDARFERALKDENLALIVYCADGTNPRIVQVNTPYDNRTEYDSLINELRGERVRRVDPEFDVQNISGLFDKLDFVAPASNVLKYGAVDWHFHVTSDFWEQGYNESLIASLCFVMGVDHFENANFRLRCYFSRYDDLEYDEDYPFGKKNFCNLDFRPYYY